MSFYSSHHSNWGDVAMKLRLNYGFDSTVKGHDFFFRRLLKKPFWAKCFVLFVASRLNLQHTCNNTTRTPQNESKKGRDYLSPMQNWCKFLLAEGSGSARTCSVWWLGAEQVGFPEEEMKGQITFLTQRNCQIAGETSGFGKRARCRFYWYCLTYGTPLFHMCRRSSSSPAPSIITTILINYPDAPVSW